MIPYLILKSIIEKCKNAGIQLILAGDPKQCQPVKRKCADCKKKNIKSENSRCKKCINTKTYNIFKNAAMIKQCIVFEKTKEDLRRQKDEDIKNLVDYLYNTKSDINDQIKYVLTYCKNIYKSFPKSEIDISNLEKDNYQKHITSDDVYIAFTNNDINNHMKQNNMQNGSTIHSYQGKTIKSPKKLFLSLNKIHMQPELLYTAISRIEYIEQLCLILL